MRFWDFFKAPATHEQQPLSRLHDKIRRLFPQGAPDPEHEEGLVKIACLAGLLARVAYIDFHIDDVEKKQMKAILHQLGHLEMDEVKAIVALACDEIKELAGLENHKYCGPLNELMNNEQKYDILISLFAIAASDGEVGHQETEEIRIISMGLQLEHKHFISARMTVKDKLSLLRA